MKIVVPEALTASHVRWDGEAGRAWTAGLPALAGRYLEEWELRLDGEPGHGVVSLVLPVVRADGTPAALKLQPVTDENVTEAVGLRAWAGDGSVRLLAEDPATGTLLLERLHAGRSLSAVPDDLEALAVLTALLARLVAHPAPPGLRRLADLARGMLDGVDRALAALPGEDDRRRLRRWAGALAEVAAEPGDRLLHWDLHYDNVLAADREPWLAIDPKPLAGDPGFDLWPALHNRWADLAATGDVGRAALRRFDLMADVLGLDPRRAARWTLGRALQNALWDVEGGAGRLDEAHATLADAVARRL
ncbi:aminoglycoside phosphotransferase family protein [Actinomadura sp. ATCC 31491]|uniref:Aminoglycoside phosphotransferase family protein n=1 Tax=Actinomadura luzonensis TaxID=2805427 RepID=A0ABT0FP78_9ACTN|nr:aminoglycoside phosphotransferase family protein [Actinomadura luzonensis]MCK2214117.1 aminoglycoside phosphotransferase family protein [Actinomadura luzonensis]